ncbi:MAG: hypothetical protein ABUK08_00310 [Candidatus Humimicrobiaceae bacterium]
MDINELFDEQIEKIDKEIDRLKSYILCPGCGYQITVTEKTDSLYDYPCPRCHKHKISEFITIRNIIKEAVND